MSACAEWLRELGARSVLDLGCWVGRWTVWLRQQGFDAAGADFAPNGIRHANDWAADEGLVIPFVCGEPGGGRSGCVSS
jgi:2-polyprenyl-3-methyl-5-hydroxy-6-metoxy-1,4-benzoquinol methylase